MKRIILTIAAAALVCLMCLSATACTVKIKDPSITDDKAELKSVEIKAENTTTHTVNGENAQALFDLVRGFGELDKEALDIGISGYTGVKTEYDYTFKISYTAGNFFRREEGKFTYNVGERVIRTRENGESNVKYDANKLVCINGLVKRTAELSDAQLEKVKSVFESVNGTVMPSAFERAAAKAEEMGFLTEKIPSDVIISVAAEAFGSLPLDAGEHILEGYEIREGNAVNYLFYTTDAQWATSLEKYASFSRVGRICYFWSGRGYDEIRNTIMS